MSLAFQGLQWSDQAQGSYPGKNLGTSKVRVYLYQTLMAPGFRGGLYKDGYTMGTYKANNFERLAWSSGVTHGD